MPDAIEAAPPASLAERIEALVEHLDEEEALLARLDERAKRIKAMQEERKLRIQKIRRSIANEMDAERVKTLRLGEATITMAEEPPKLIVTDEAALPDWYFQEEVVRKLDKAALREALEEGMQIDGATLSNGGVRLQIKRL
jgi:hypothetical protein